MEEKKPIKRNINLKYLSHEHHHGLVFCSRLKQTGKTEAEVLRIFVQEFWENYLYPHFKLEETLLLPLIKNKPMENIFLTQHKQIMEQVHKILLANTSKKDQEARTLSKMITEHIRFEERELFPWIEENSPAEDLESVGKQFDSKEVNPHYFSPEFWKL